LSAYGFFVDILSIGAFRQFVPAQSGAVLTWPPPYQFLRADLTFALLTRVFEAGGAQNAE
jgi:hypothetical protein